MHQIYTDGVRVQMSACKQIPISVKLFFFRFLIQISMIFFFKKEEGENDPAVQSILYAIRRSANPIREIILEIHAHQIFALFIIN